MPVWGYITEFWNSITTAIVGGATYGIDWFQSVGNAVAGAVGGLLGYLIHWFSDLFIFLGWFSQNMGVVFKFLFTPFQFVYAFLSEFTAKLFETSIDPGIDITITDYLEIIPYSAQIIGILSIGLMTLVFFFLIKQLQKI